MSKKVFVSLLVFTLVSTLSLMAQNADDVLRYNLEYPTYDPVSLVVPAVSQPTGFGAYQENPASMALFEETFFSFGLSSRFIDETGSYLGNSSTSSDNQTSVGDLGLVYKVPTTRGSLVVGGGYSQTTDFNRTFSVGGYNEESTLTDYFADLSRENDINEAAFNAYAIEDVNTDSSVSIFRFGADFSAFPGINQDVELTERGKVGEYSVFLATELLKNFHLGGSVGYFSGSYSYDREFLESDRRGNYEGNFIDSDGDGNFDTDIDQIYSADAIDADISAFSARLGLIYQPLNQLNIGVSYKFPTKLHIDEDYGTEILTTFDNGTQTALEEVLGQFSYKIVRPHRLKAGFTAKSSSGLRFIASAEGVFYSDARIEYDEIELNPEEDAINEVVRSSLDDAINLRGGLEFDVNDNFTPRVGYAYFPNPQENVGSARQFISGGFSAVLTRGLIFDFGLQYSFWDDQNTLYSTPEVSETVQEEVTRLNAMVGLRMAL